MNDQIILIAKKIVEQEGFFVAAAKMITKSKIQILVDGQSSVSLKLCSLWNHKIRENIEQEIPEYQDGNFELEVSSFGIGEPLVDVRQYAINRGRKIKVDYIDDMEKAFQTTGKLIDTDDENIIVEKIIGKGKKASVETQKINIKKIKKAIIEVDF